jgi:glutamine synthetase
MAEKITPDSLPRLLEADACVKLAGLDVDGILRGKLVSKKKFLSIASSGFGFCSVIFGWDMHDQTYMRELGVSNLENGYRDILAIPDLASFRRIPWEDNVPFFLVSFFDPDTMEPICACPRGLLQTQLTKLKDKGYGAMAGGASMPVFSSFLAPSSFPFPIALPNPRLTRDSRQPSTSSTSSGPPSRTTRRPLPS